MQYVYLVIQIIVQIHHIIKKLIHALGAGLVRVAPTVETTFLQYWSQLNPFKEQLDNIAQNVIHIYMIR